MKPTHTITLNSRDKYEGSHNWFQGLEGNGGVLEMDVGQVTLRVGGVKHCGKALTAGTRYIIGGFCLHRKKPESVRMLLADPSNCAGLEAAIVLNPACDFTYSLLANVCEQQGETAKAQEVLEYCLQSVEPRAAKVCYALSIIYMDQGLFCKADQCLQTCLSVDLEDVDALMVAAHQCCAAAMGDSTKEESYYQMIISIPDANLHTLATAYVNLGDLHKDEEVEIEYYNKSLQLKPKKNFMARYNLASALASREQYKPACQTFHEAIGEVHKDGEDDENIAKALQSASLQSNGTAGVIASPRSEFIAGASFATLSRDHGNWMAMKLSQTVIPAHQD